MKKIIFLLFTVAILTSCDCVLSQMPPQYLYAGESCTAPLPDYKAQVVVTGGCFGFTVSQVPAPGTILTAQNNTQTVIIKATGNNGKSSQISFTVTMLDTITPKITLLAPLVDANLKQIKAMYDAADNLVIKNNKLLDDSIPGFSALTKDGSMMIMVSIDSAGSGIRKRFLTYADTLVLDPAPQIKPYSVSWDSIINKPYSYVPTPHSHLWDNITDAPNIVESMIDSISWTKIYGLENLNRVPYLVDYRNFMDWQAYAEYMPIPTRTPTVAPDLTLVNSNYKFSPLVYDDVAKKLKFWNGTVWKTITSN